MVYLWLLIISLSLALLGKGVVGLPLVMPAVLAVSFYIPTRESLISAFFAGLLVSFVNGTYLGGESLALLVGVGLVRVYGSRFSSRHWANIAVFAGLGTIVYFVATGLTISFGRLVVEILLVYFFIPAAIWFNDRFFSDTITLKV